MRKLLCFLGAAFYIFLSSSFKNKGVAEININVTGNSNEKVYINKKNLEDNGEDQTISTVSLNSNKKNESVKIKNDSPTIIYIVVRNLTRAIYIDEKSTSYIDIDISNNSQINFSFRGTFSSINNYLQAKRQLVDSLFSLNDLKKNYAISPDQFRLLNEQLIENINKLRSKYLTTGEVDNRFKQFDSLDVASLILIRKTLYPDYHHYLTKEKTPKQYSLDTLKKDISFDNGNGLLSNSFTRLLSMYIMHLLKQNKVPENLSLKEEDLLYFSQKYELATSLFKNKDISQYFVSETLLGALDVGLDSFYTERINSSQTLFGNTRYLNSAINKFTALQKVGAGEKAPEFEVIDLNGVKKKLDDFIGKNILINVWSFGCSHSVDELVYLNRIIDQFRTNENIVFLNIYLGNDKNELSKYLTDKMIKGQNVMLTKDTFSKSYFVNSLPRYILIDKLGKIINPFADKPSSPNLIKELKKLSNN